MNCEIWEVLDGTVDTPLSRIVDEHRLEQETEQVYEELLEEAETYADYRSDLRDQLTYAIDPASARDRDDAFSVGRQYDDGVLSGYTAHVHIVDVPEYIKEDSMIDAYAERRGFTIYGGRANHMLPEALVQEIGFMEGEDRLANTFEFTFDTDGILQEYDLYPSIVNIDQTLTYDEANAHVKESKDDWASDSMKGMICTLEDSAFLSTRLAQASDRSFNRSTARRIIDEFMIKANEIGANELLAAGRGLYRNHEKRTENAHYSPACQKHKGLGLTEYAHFTSPLRRYPDLLNWRVLREETAYTNQGLEELAEHLNEREQNIEKRGRTVTLNDSWKEGR